MWISNFHSKPIDALCSVSLCSAYIRIVLWPIPLWLKWANAFLVQFLNFVQVSRGCHFNQPPSHNPITSVQLQNIIQNGTSIWEILCGYVSPSTWAVEYIFDEILKYLFWNGFPRLIEVCRRDILPSNRVESQHSIIVIFAFPISFLTCFHFSFVENSQFPQERKPIHPVRIHPFAAIQSDFERKLNQIHWKAFTTSF